MTAGVGLPWGFPGKAGVTSFWDRFNFRIKHQLYLRILPVVAVSVLAVGAFSGRLLTSRAERTYQQQESLENTNALRRVVERISVQALLAEVQRDDRLTPLMREAAPGTHRATAERFLGGMLRRETVRGAAIVSVGANGRAAFVAAAFDTDLAGSANADSLKAWIGNAWSGLASADWTDLQAGTSWTRGPRTVDIDREHSLWIFDPLPLARGAGGADMVLPTVVFEGALVPDDWGEASHSGRARMHVVLMLDIPSLLGEWFDDGTSGELQPGEFQAAVDERGRLLCVERRYAGRRARSHGSRTGCFPSCPGRGSRGPAPPRGHRRHCPGHPGLASQSAYFPAGAAAGAAVRPALGPRDVEHQRRLRSLHGHHRPDGDDRPARLDPRHHFGR